ncbi:MAG: hypothetical protein K5705_10320 [Oscillospiraceae bacterium]|nr:hypothetical protein [Oscillospiraceae bacterium]MCR4760643.1 hypothetical protein [Oscillospiraceae bacterium]
MTNNRWLWTCIAAMIAAATAIAATILTVPAPLLPQPVLPMEYAAAQAAETQSAPAAAPESLPDTAYLLKLSGDRLSVFAEGERNPVAEYDLPAGWLPDYDRILLEYGLRAGNARELRRLLEDYVS